MSTRQLMHMKPHDATRRRLARSGMAVMGMATLPARLLTACAARVPEPDVQGKGKAMKLICLEEHVLDPALVRASMPSALALAPYLPDWGKTVQDGHNPDRSRPQIERNASINPKAFDLGAGRLKDMDDAAIDMQVLSVGGFPHLASGRDAIAMHRAANDRLAEAVKAHPTRFSAFATLPWNEPEAAREELIRAVRQLGFKGALLNGRPGSHFLDHPDYQNLLTAFNDLRVPLFLHPGVPVQAVQQVYYGGFSPEVSARLSMFGWGWHHEAGIHLLRLILSGAFDHNPELKVISGHWGEMLPFYLQRLDDSIPQSATGLKRSITQTFRDQVYVTPSGMLTLPHFRFIVDLVGAGRIVYSVDYPYQTLDGVRSFIDKLPLSITEKEMIAWRNAATLLDISI